MFHIREFISSRFYTKQYDRGIMYSRKIINLQYITQFMNLPIHLQRFYVLVNLTKN